VSTWRIARLIAAKDLRIELRSRVVTNQVLPFAALVMVMFAFALDNDNVLTRVAPGLVWLATMFSMLVLVQRSFAVESADGALDALQVAGVRPAGIFLGKSMALAAQLAVLEVVLLLAAIVLYQLYSVLGRRVGRQPGDEATPDQTRSLPVRDEPDAPLEDDGVQLTGLAALRARDPAFDLTRFLGGARSAYEMVVKAFAAGDRETLKKLLSSEVMASFESGIAAREAEGTTDEVEFLQAPRADMEKADVTGDSARITVRFLAEFRSRSKGPEGEAVDDRRTAELWTFERNLTSRDPNWTLVHVDAAEA
jgi:predicted lipid-binding transport protein (Tim44 family)